MLIDNINADLHGTAIDCLFEEGRSTTVIDIIRNGTPDCNVYSGVLKFMGY